MFEANPTIRRMSEERAVSGDLLTFNGVINRTGILLLTTGVTFALTWRGIQSGDLPPAVYIGGMIVGLILGLIISFTRITNPFAIGTYAAAEGVFLGGLSYLVSLRYPGIALQAVAGTIGCFSIVLALYSMRVLRATPIFVKVITAAILGIGLLYIVSMVARLLGSPLAFMIDSSPLSIGISAFIVLIASLSFVIDFATIEQAVEEGSEARLGWRFAFGLLVGLVWLYLEILRLLMKLRGRD